MTLDDLKKYFPNASLQNWHQHKNGGGWVENTAHVDDDARVSGDALVYGDARVSGAAWVSGDARVYGDAQVSGDARVYGDAWEFSPFYLQGSKHALTTSNKNKITIGCESNPVKHWLKHYQEIGEKHNYPQDVIDEYGMLIRCATEWLKMKFGKLD